MIKKLKIRFVVLAMTALVTLLTVIVTGMNLINYNSVVAEADVTLSVLSQNKGAFPEPEPGGMPGGHMPHGMSPEVPYESRFFSVFLDGSYNVLNAEMSKIASVDRETASEYAKKALDSGETAGFVDEFRFVRQEETSGYRIIFLDCGRKLDSFRDFLYSSIAMAAVGLVIVFFAVFVLSGRIIRPIAESYEKQKRFITDAGHEIKTPLTIINANVDILEMEFGENESLSDIAQQTRRLRTLTDDLVMLARMEEAEGSMQKVEFPLSEVVAEAAHPFQALAIQQGKELACNIQPMLTLNGNPKAIGQLISIFLDNALKYSPAGCTVFLSVVRQNRSVVISVFNPSSSEISQDGLSRIFDRFYRTDESRNSETGGHGIGLSVAMSIVNAHDGKLHARTPDGRSLEITAVLPG